MTYGYGELELEYIYLIVTQNGYYVGRSKDPISRAKQHEYDRYTGTQREFHEDMRLRPYYVYILDCRLGLCEMGLEDKWIYYFAKMAEAEGKKCWNTNQTKDDSSYPDFVRQRRHFITWVYTKGEERK